MSEAANSHPLGDDLHHNMIAATTSADNQNTESSIAKDHISQMYDLSRFDNSNQNDSSCFSMNSMKCLVNRTFKRRGNCGDWIKKRVPILGWLPKYKPKRFLLPDAMAGFTVGIMNIPQGLAYALLATLNPIYGLYVSFFPIIVYTIFGTCRHLIIG